LVLTVPLLQYSTWPAVSQQPTKPLTCVQVRVPLEDDALDAVEVEEELDVDVLEEVEDALVEEALVLVEEALVLVEEALVEAVLVEEAPVVELADEELLAAPAVVDVLVEKAPVPLELPPSAPPELAVAGVPPCPEEAGEDPPVATTSPTRSGP
jgi:hypothetical protein